VSKPAPIVPGVLLDELVYRGSRVRCPRMGGCGAWTDRLLIVEVADRAGQALLICRACYELGRRR
jgi:hypothetical protein